MLKLDFTSFPELETERLFLRQLTNSDIAEIFFLRSDENVLRFIGKEPVKDLQEAEDFIKRVNEECKAGKSILWGIVLKQAPDTVIGTICFWNIKMQHYRAEIGYVLHPSYWRKGMMKEAILKVLDYGFTKMELHSIEARISARNAPSAAILKATGFIQEGYLKEELYFQEKFFDSVIYSKLRE